jgi:SAM-dependent methyltransferase
MKSSMKNDSETLRLRDFWNKRYDRFSLQESGIISLSPKANFWMYRCKEHAYRHALRSAQLDLRKPVRLLDGGCGQGFFASLYKKIFRNSSYTGIDVSDKVIEYLRQIHPDCRWICANIGAPDFHLENEYDLVQSIEVLHLIIDDQHHSQALQHLCNALAPGGTVLLTDIFPQERFQVGNYLVYRPLAHYQNVFSEFGLHVLGVQPMYYWLPDFSRPDRPLGKFKSRIPGRIVYGLDRLLLWSRLPQIKPSHDSRMKMIVAKKPR